MPMARRCRRGVGPARRPVGRAGPRMSSVAPIWTRMCPTSLRSVGATPGMDPNFECSGWRWEPKWVLTALHCVIDFRPQARAHVLDGPGRFP